MKLKKMKQLLCIMLSLSIVFNSVSVNALTVSDNQISRLSTNQVSFNSIEDSISDNDVDDTTNEEHHHHDTDEGCSTNTEDTTTQKTTESQNKEESTNKDDEILEVEVVSDNTTIDRNGVSTFGYYDTSYSVILKNGVAFQKYNSLYFTPIDYNKETGKYIWSDGEETEWFRKHFESQAPIKEVEDFFYYKTDTLYAYGEDDTLIFVSQDDNRVYSIDSSGNMNDLTVNDKLAYDQYMYTNKNGYAYKIDRDSSDNEVIAYNINGIKGTLNTNVEYMDYSFSKDYIFIIDKLTGDIFKANIGTNEVNKVTNLSDLGIYGDPYYYCIIAATDTNDMIITNNSYIDTNDEEDSGVYYVKDLDFENAINLTEEVVPSYYYMDEYDGDYYKRGYSIDYNHDRTIYTFSGLTDNIKVDKNKTINNTYEMWYFTIDKNGISDIKTTNISNEKDLYASKLSMIVNEPGDLIYKYDNKIASIEGDFMDYAENINLYGYGDYKVDVCDSSYYAPIKTVPSDGVSCENGITHTIKNSQTSAKHDVKFLPGNHYITDDYIVLKNATCKATGLEAKQCEYCGKIEETLEIPVDIYAHSYTTKTTEATCIAEGKKVTTCSECGDTEEEVLPINKDNHVGNLTGYTVIKEATTQADGIYQETCDACDSTVKGVLPSIKSSMVAVTMYDTESSADRIIYIKDGDIYSVEDTKNPENELNKGYNIYKAKAPEGQSFIKIFSIGDSVAGLTNKGIVKLYSKKLDAEDSLETLSNVKNYTYGYNNVTFVTNDNSIYYLTYDGTYFRKYNKSIANADIDSAITTGEYALALVGNDVYLCKYSSSGYNFTKTTTLPEGNYEIFGDFVYSSRDFSEVYYFFYNTDTQEVYRLTLDSGRAVLDKYKSNIESIIYSTSGDEKILFSEKVQNGTETTYTRILTASNRWNPCLFESYEGFTESIDSSLVINPITKKDYIVNYNGNIHGVTMHPNGDVYVNSDLFFNANRTATAESTLLFNINDHWHFPTFDSQELKNPNNCNEGAIATYKCDCGYSYTEDVFVKHIKSKTKQHVLAEADCKTQGRVITKCEVCDKSLDVETIEPIMHTCVEVEPTCTSTGLLNGTCEMCGETFDNVIIDAKLHSNIKTEPTCSSKGVYGGVCEYCGGDYTDVKIPYKGHYLQINSKKQDYITKINDKYYVHCIDCGIKQEVKVTKQPTCKGKGKGTVVQQFNSLKATIEIDIPVLGHEFETIEIVEDPSCTSTGLSIVKCKNCNVSMECETAKGEHDYEIIDSRLQENVTGDFDALYSRLETSIYECRTCGYTYTKEYARMDGHSSIGYGFYYDYMTADENTGQVDIRINDMGYIDPPNSEMKFIVSPISLGFLANSEYDSLRINGDTVENFLGLDDSSRATNGNISWYTKDTKEERKSSDSTYYSTVDNELFMYGKDTTNDKNYFIMAVSGVAVDTEYYPVTLEGSGFTSEIYELTYDGISKPFALRRNSQEQINFTSINKVDRMQSSPYKTKYYLVLVDKDDNATDLTYLIKSGLSNRNNYIYLSDYLYGYTPTNFTTESYWDSLLGEYVDYEAEYTMLMDVFEHEKFDTYTGVTHILANNTTGKYDSGYETLSIAKSFARDKNRVKDISLDNSDANFENLFTIFNVSPSEFPVVEPNFEYYIADTNQKIVNGSVIDDISYTINEDSQLLAKPVKNLEDTEAVKIYCIAADAAYPDIESKRIDAKLTFNNVEAELELSKQSIETEKNEKHTIKASAIYDNGVELEEGAHYSWYFTDTKGNTTTIYEKPSSFSLLRAAANLLGLNDYENVSENGDEIELEFNKDGVLICQVNAMHGIARANATVDVAGNAEYNVVVNNGTGDGDYFAGDIVTIIADAPEAGKKFTGWRVDSGIVTFEDANSAQTTFTMPDTNVEVTALYDYIDYNVTVNTSGKGTATSDKTTAHIGEKVTISATPNRGYKFNKWIVETGGVSILDENNSNSEFNMATDDTIITAEFKAIDYTIEVVGDENGTASADKTIANIDDIVRLTATPNRGYKFDYWEVVSGDITIDNTNNKNSSFIVGSENIVIKAHFKYGEFEIKVEADGEGTASADKTVAHIGEKVKIKAVPNRGYELDTWIVNAGNVTIDNVKDLDTEFTMDIEDVDITAKFKYKDLTIKVNAEGNGTASADKTISHIGDTIKIKAVPDRGYKLVGWEVVAGDITIKDIKSLDTEFIMNAENVEITAKFDYQYYNIQILNDGNGTATSDKTTAHIGETISINAVPNNGYEFSNWEVISGSINVKDIKSSNSEFIMDASDIIIKANFKSINKDEDKPSLYNIIVKTDGNGEASSSKTVAYEHDTIEISATPHEGYEFDTWVVEYGNVTIKDKYNSNSEFNVTKHDVLIVAKFKEKAKAKETKYNITVLTDGNGTASANKLIAKKGETVKLTAKPAPGYKFNKWAVETGGVKVANNKFTMKSKDVIVVATFKKIDVPPVIIDTTPKQPNVVHTGVEDLSSLAVGFTIMTLVGILGTFIGVSRIRKRKEDAE